MIQAIIFIKTVLKYYAPILSCRAIEYNAPTNSSDISFRDLLVRNCLSYNPNFARYEQMVYISTQKVEILCYKIIRLPKIFDENWRRYIVWTWKQFNNGRLDCTEGAAPAILASTKCTLSFVVKSNYHGFFKEHLYEMFISQTVSCMTSDDILR
jgi:hypothetical protein